MTAHNPREIETRLAGTNTEVQAGELGLEASVQEPVVVVVPAVQAAAEPNTVNCNTEAAFEFEFACDAGETDVKEVKDHGVLELVVVPMEVVVDAVEHSEAVGAALAMMGVCMNCDGASQKPS